MMCLMACSYAGKRFCVLLSRRTARELSTVVPIIKASPPPASLMQASYDKEALSLSSTQLPCKVAYVVSRRSENCRVDRYR